MKQIVSDIYLAERFGMSEAPLLQGPVLPFLPPITFARITHRHTSHGRSISPPRENAFSL